MRSKQTEASRHREGFLERETLRKDEKFSQSERQTDRQTDKQKPTKTQRQKSQKEKEREAIAR